MDKANNRAAGLLGTLLDPANLFQPRGLHLCGRF